MVLKSGSEITIRFPNDSGARCGISIEVHGDAWNILTKGRILAQIGISGCPMGKINGGNKDKTFLRGRPNSMF